MNRLLLGILSAALLLPGLALADATQLYKWTDADGVLHLSDQPPPQSVADVQVQDIPQFPPVDPEKLAQQQAALTAQLAALQQLLNAQAAQQAQAAALAAQKAELEAELAALQQQQSQPSVVVPLIYSTPAFISRAFHSNLYVFHHRPKPLPPMQMRIGKPGDPVQFKP
ncbi:MAG: DUF4124 domain-containing protein [Bacillota bacterium]